MGEEIMNCVFCGSTKNVIKHHASYEPEIIQHLCRSCHRREHMKKPELKSPISTICVSEQTLDRIKQQGRYGETMDGILNRIMNGLEKKELNEK